MTFAAITWRVVESDKPHRRALRSRTTFYDCLGAMLYYVERSRWTHIRIERMGV